MSTAEIINEFTALVNTDQEYSLAELKTILGDIYKTKHGKVVRKPKAVKIVETMKTDKKEDSDDDMVMKKGKGKGKKAGKTGDVVKAKRAPSAYNIYMKTKGAEIKENDPSVKSKDVMALVAIEWKKLSDIEKASYKPKSEVVVSDDDQNE